jgi:hypothetical protein
VVVVVAAVVAVAEPEPKEVVAVAEPEPKEVVAVAEPEPKEAAAAVVVERNSTIYIQ